MATSINITYGKLYTIGKSKLCWFQTCANGVGRQSGREDMSKTKMALNPRLRLEVFHVTVKRPSKVGQRKVRSLVRNRKTSSWSLMIKIVVIPQHPVTVVWPSLVAAVKTGNNLWLFSVKIGLKPGNSLHYTHIATPL